MYSQLSREARSSGFSYRDVRNVRHALENIHVHCIYMNIYTVLYMYIHMYTVYTIMYIIIMSICMSSDFVSKEGTCMASNTSR